MGEARGGGVFQLGSRTLKLRAQDLFLAVSSERLRAAWEGQFVCSVAGFSLAEVDLMAGRPACPPVSLKMAGFAWTIASGFQSGPASKPERSLASTGKHERGIDVRVALDFK